MANKKKLQVWLPLLLSLCIVAGMFIGYRIKGNMPNRGIFLLERQKPLQEVLELINRKYVDEVNIDSLGNIAIETILSGLDPHSAYISPPKLQEINESLEGIFFGIGIEYSVIHDTSTALHVIQGGPAQKAGLLPGDKFIRIDDSLVAGNRTNAETFRRLTRGKAGSMVKVDLLRNGKPLTAEIKRGPVRLFSIDAAYMVDDTTGFIRINKFSETTYKEFMEAMDTLGNRGMQALILDLRDNAGGIFTEAIHIADEFLSGDKLITYTVGTKSPRKEYKANKAGVFEEGKLVVIVNEGTASASEVLAGALQDWDRATIVGRRSFGKGLVQEQYELSDGSGLRLTVARYFTPLGRSIQRPYENGSQAYYHDIIDRFKSGEMSSADSINYKGLPQFKTPSGHIVYSGGGISPDVFVSVDTMEFEKPVMRAVVKRTLDRFVFENFVKKQSVFSGMKTVDQFERGFEVDEPTLRHFAEFAVQDSVFVDLRNANQKHQLAIQIKKLTGRLLWGTQGFYQIKNQTDSMFTKSYEVIKTGR